MKTLKLFVIIIICIPVIFSSCNSYYYTDYSVYDCNNSNNNKIKELEKEQAIEIKIAYNNKVVYYDTLCLDSIIVNYYSNGGVSKFMGYKNGSIYGEYIEYYFNGQLLMRKYYGINGLIDGKYYSYCIDGSIESEMIIKNSKTKVLKYYYKGNVVNIRIYKNNGKLKRKLFWDYEKNKFVKDKYGDAHDVNIVF